MVKNKPENAAPVDPGSSKDSNTRKRSLRKTFLTDDSDICHDFEDNVIETSRDSVEVADEISINPTDFREKISYSPKDPHLKPERWKYKTRKKRKKADDIIDEKDDARVLDVVDECSVNSFENDLELPKKKIKLEYGNELYNKMNGIKTTNGLDSTGNSENQSSSDDNKRKPKPTWKVKTATDECDVCGKEMLISRLTKHMKIAHKCSKKLYPCDECSFNAENIIELKKHLRKRHKLSIGTVRKMIKFMKMNRKHRMSMLEDDEESAITVTRNRHSGGALRSRITDELHQTDSDIEKRTRQAATRTNYKELSFDDDDWDAAMAEDTDTESDAVEEDIEEEEEDEEDEETKCEEYRESSHDSGRETQTHTELSADEVENLPEKVEEEKKDNSAELEDLLQNMTALQDHEKAAPGDRFYTKQQKDLLFSYYNLNTFPSTEHRQTLSDKTGIEPRRVYYWFDNNRRLDKNKQERESRSSQPVVHGEREKRVRKPRASSPQIFTASKPNSSGLNRGGGAILEYDPSKIVRGDKSVDETLEAGEAVCIGVDITPQNCRCLLCNYSCSFRGNLYKHLRQSHDFEPKFCALPREKSELDSDAKGCRKTFSIETFDLHTCTADTPTCFGDEIKIDKRFRTGVANSNGVSSDDSDNDEGTREIEVVENLRKQGKAVCLGFEMTDSQTKCCLCDVSAACRGNLYKHINSHGYSVKFCCNPREKSELEEGNKGCRKIFLEETFDEHICTSEDPEQLGHFPLDRTQKQKKKFRKGRGGFRGFEKNFGVPDGSPAKYYNDRYTRLFHQLAIRTNIGVTLDTTFIRNGKMELCYLSDRQMTAVKDYLDDNDTYILVRKIGFRLFCHG